MAFRQILLRMLILLPANWVVGATTVTPSIPVGICSKFTSFSSKTWRIFRQKPNSPFIMSFSTVRAEKPFRPAIPVMGRAGSLSLLGRIRVPGAEGLQVFLMRIGMPAIRTGRTESSCRTVAPM